jgi:hypothetical protein
VQTWIRIAATLAGAAALAGGRAVLAPSSHDTQPWRFEPAGDGVRVHGLDRGSAGLAGTARWRTVRPHSAS